MQGMFVMYQPMELIDIRNIGAPIVDDPSNFRWPTQEDLAALDLTEPLRLTAVRTRGVN